nr:hypothetical protein KitaXyl93_00900 [Kitasatospora sp. Xyl93]
MLGYEDVLKADPGTLAAAAAKWREMAQKFHTMESDFDQKVLSVTRNGLWTGGTASMANFQLAITKGQITAAQVEANAVASLLDDAKSDFEAAQKQVRDAADGAVKDGFKVTGTGVAVLDTSTMDKATLNALHHDREAQDAYNEAAAKWTKAIEAGLQAATDADTRAATALRSASKAGSPDNTFNGQAVGGGDAADAQRAAALATRIDGLGPQERDQLANLMKANADSPQFSQTLLDKLGPGGMLKLAQQLDSPGDDGGKKAAYPSLRTDLTRALASATRDPDSDFYKKWRADMKGAGDKNYGSNTQPVYGYQILTTMMTKGSGKYSTPFLTDLADDITATEKDHQGLWSYKANHTGTALGADPLDNVLTVRCRTHWRRAAWPPRSRPPPPASRPAAPTTASTPKRRPGSCTTPSSPWTRARAATRSRTRCAGRSPTPSPTTSGTPTSCSTGATTSTVPTPGTTRSGRTAKPCGWPSARTAWSGSCAGSRTTLPRTVRCTRRRPDRSPRISPPSDRTPTVTR